MGENSPELDVIDDFATNEKFDGIPDSEVFLKKFIIKVIYINKKG